MTRLATPRKRNRLHVPPFTPVPLRARQDGWTARRQADFLGVLAETRSVAKAARAVGMARETAYRLRAHDGAESFAQAWDVALGKAKPNKHASRKVTGDALWHRALWGVLCPQFYRGRYTGTARKTDNTALLRLIANPSAASGSGWRHERVTGADPCKPDYARWWPRSPLGGEGSGRSGGAVANA